MPSSMLGRAEKKALSLRNVAEQMKQTEHYWTAKYEDERLKDINVLNRSETCTSSGEKLPGCQRRGWHCQGLLGTAIHRVHWVEGTGARWRRRAGPEIQAPPLTWLHTQPRASDLQAVRPWGSDCPESVLFRSVLNPLQAFSGEHCLLGFGQH